jgi:hypothetical protein
MRNSICVSSVDELKFYSKSKIIYFQPLHILKGKNHFPTFRAWWEFPHSIKTFLIGLHLKTWNYQTTTSMSSSLDHHSLIGVQILQFTTVESVSVPEPIHSDDEVDSSICLQEILLKLKMFGFFAILVFFLFILLWISRLKRNTQSIFHIFKKA